MAQEPLSPEGGRHYHLGVPLARERVDAVRQTAKARGYRSVCSYVRALIEADIDSDAGKDTLTQAS